MTCPRCGAEASGRFCSTCGAALGGGACPSCGASLSPGAKFCHACGAVVGAPAGMPGLAPTPRSNTAWVPWAIAGVAVVGLLVVAIVFINRSETQAPTAQGSQVPSDQMATTDISSMSPKEAAQRLFDRVVSTAQAADSDAAHGDTAAAAQARNQVAFFAPMTIQAYARVPTLGNDDHYDLGLIKGLLNDPAGELAEADTIAKAVPTHLFASMLRFDAAQAQHDSAAMRRAATNFLNHYPSEMTAGRLEYGDRAGLIASYRTRFLQLLGKGSG